MALLCWSAGGGVSILPLNIMIIIVILSDVIVCIIVYFVMNLLRFLFLLIGGLVFSFILSLVCRLIVVWLRLFFILLLIRLHLLSNNMIWFMMLTCLMLTLEKMIELLSKRIILLLHCKIILHSILHRYHSLFISLLFYLMIRLSTLFIVLCHLMMPIIPLIFIILSLSCIITVDIINLICNTINFMLFSSKWILINIRVFRWLLSILLLYYLTSSI
jgi:hypothetical protein